jgi:hypothetical protein
MNIFERLLGARSELESNWIGAAVELLETFRAKGVE